MCRSITTKFTLQGKFISPSQSRKAQTLKFCGIFFCNLIFQRCKYKTNGLTNEETAVSHEYNQVHKSTGSVFTHNSSVNDSSNTNTRTKKSSKTKYTAFITYKTKNNKPIKKKRPLKGFFTGNYDTSSDSSGFD